MSDNVAVPSPSQVDEAWQRGHEAWPSLDIALPDFASYVTSFTVDALQRFAGDAYLACGCLQGQPAAIQGFEDHVMSAAKISIRAVDGTPEFVDEACQRVRAALLVSDPDAPAKISSYVGRGPLRAWVGVTAARTALMMKRTTSRSKEIATDDWTTSMTRAAIGNPELELLKKQHANEFANAIKQAAAELPIRLRTALRMHFVDQLSIDEIGVAYAVHRATAARWLQRAKDMLFERTRVLLIEKLQISPSEIDRIAMLVQSQLDVSMSQLLPIERLSDRALAPVEASDSTA